MLKSLPLLIIAILSTGCAPQHTVDPYGYEYTHITPMGIMYRIDTGGAAMDPGEIDYNYSAVANCAGSYADPSELLVVSTAADVNPESSYIVEGRAWQPHAGNPARIVLNITLSPERFGAIMPHELVHYFAKMDAHDSEMFKDCGAVIY